MSALLAVIGLSLSLWNGANYATTDMAAVRYRLEITGTPGTAVHLRAEDVARGWIAAFCTPRLCSPQRVDAVMPPSGRTIFAFELFRETSSAAKTSAAIIRSADGGFVRVP